MTTDGGEIERHEKYECLLLTCDPTTVVRLGVLLCRDLGIDAPSENIRSVRIAPPPNGDPPRRNAWWWANTVALVIGGGSSSLATIVGYYIIVQWIMLRLS